MKKLINRVVAVVAIIVAPLLIGASASAQQATCEIGYTGPDSQNMCTISYTCSVDVENSNNVVIKDQTGQTAASGTVTNSGNTGTGGATSGTVSNDSGTVFNVTITNTTPDAPKTCTATTSVPATQPETPTPTTPTTTSTEGQGMVLPATTADPLQVGAFIAAASALVVSLAASGVIWYRQHKSL